jgi:hypothetical protein
MLLNYYLGSLKSRDLGKARSNPRDGAKESYRIYPRLMHEWGASVIFLLLVSPDFIIHDYVHLNGLFGSCVAWIASLELLVSTSVPEWRPNRMNTVTLSWLTRQPPTPTASILTSLRAAQARSAKEITKSRKCCYSKTLRHWALLHLPHLIKASTAEHNGPLS